MEKEPVKPSNTKVIFDLADELTPEEIAAFTKAAEAAGANLTDHFLNITIRLREGGRAA